MRSKTHTNAISAVAGMESSWRHSPQWNHIWRHTPRRGFMNTDKRIDGSPSYGSIAQYLSAGGGIGENLSETTKLDYCRKTLSLETELLRSGQVVTVTNMVELLRLKSDSGSYSQSTIRSMKAAVLFWIQGRTQEALAVGSDLNEIQQSFNILKSIQAKSPANKPRQTSSSKLKFFPKVVLDALEAHAAANNRTRNLGAVLSFIRANLLVGLRPSEWFDANLFSYLHTDENGNYLITASGKISSTPALMVKNAKATYGRANGYYRELLLTGISDQDLAAIMHFKEIIKIFCDSHPAKGSSEHADAFFVPLQKSLTGLLKKLGIGRNVMPTSYSTRHQVVANAKQSGKSDVEIAAFFGHSSVDTAKSHYGKKLNGWGKMTFNASKESIAAVPLRKPVPSLTPSETLTRSAAEWIQNTQV